MNIQHAYERTAAGSLPKAWEVRPLADVLQFRNGVNAAKGAYGTGIRFINVLEVITKTHLEATDIPGRVALGKEAVESYEVTRGDVLFNRTSETQEEVGLASVYDDDEPVVFGGFVIRGRPRPGVDFDATYSGYALRATAVRRQIVARGQGAIRANIGQADLRTVLIPYPPIREQRAIAEALSDIDALISSIEHLLDKKRLLKLGAMQELLSGRKRLEGFRAAWELKRLEELGTWKGGMTPAMQNPRYWNGGSVPWISSGDVKSALLTKTGFSVTDAAVTEGRTTLLPAKSVVVVTRSGILRKYLPVAMNVIPMAINQDIKALIPAKEHNPRFLLHALVGNGERILARCLKAGTTVESVEFSWLKAFSILMPPPGEQAAIAEVLSDMDAELRALERRRDKTRAIKQGMMQELLTGRTRLV
jgi:type I restriction enzyme S subunit